MNDFKICSACDKNFLKNNYNQHIESCKKFDNIKDIATNEYINGISCKELSKKYKIGHIKFKKYFIKLGIHRNQSDAHKLVFKLNTYNFLRNIGNKKCPDCNEEIIKTNYKSHIKACKKFKIIQKIAEKEYIKGLSCNELSKKYKIGFNKFKQYLKENNVYRNRSSASKLAAKIKPRKHSEETKNKLSEIRKKYLDDHPDKVPYLLNHASKMSYPEKRFKTVLNNMGIKGWIYNYQCGRYSYDFAFPLLKLDVEIDGGTHMLEKVIKSDRERDKWSISQGWKVLRFTAKECHNNLGICIDKLLSVISNLNPKYDLYDINHKWEEIKPKLMVKNKNGEKIKYYNIVKRKYPISCNYCKKEFIPSRNIYKFCSKKCVGMFNSITQKRVTRPPPIQLIEEIKSTNFCIVGRKYGVSDNAIRKWCKSYNINTKTLQFI